MNIHKRKQDLDLNPVLEICIFIQYNSLHPFLCQHANVLLHSNYWHQYSDRINGNNRNLNCHNHCITTKSKWNVLLTTLQTHRRRKILNRELILFTSQFLVITNFKFICLLTKLMRSTILYLYSFSSEALSRPINNFPFNSCLDWWRVTWLITQS